MSKSFKKTKIVSKSMKPDRIVIKKLFGKYDHEITLHQDTRVTILVGINGSGKSTILRIIEKVSRGDFSGLLTEPFASIGIGVGKMYFEFYKTKNDSIATRYKKILSGNWSKRFVFERREAQFDRMVDEREYTRYLHQQSEIIDILSRRKLPRHEKARLEDELVRTNHILSRIASRARESKPKWLKDFITGFNCYLVSSQRLFKPVSSQGDAMIENIEESRFIDIIRDGGRIAREKQVLETIFGYAENLRDTIRAAQREHSKKSLNLNQRYLSSILSGLDKRTKPKKKEVYIKEIDEIRNLERKLMSAGLLTDTHRVTLPEQFWDREFDPTIVSIIETYIDGTKEMFDVFEKLLNQTTLFSDIVNSRLTEKQLVIDAENGFTIKLQNDSILDLDKLSSGEQQTIVLAYALIFEAPEDSLVLIDEPEISLHIAWQEGITDNLRKMGESKDLIYLLATHSPSVVDKEWDITYELGR